MPETSAVPQLYLLPCSCGEKVRVRPRQAGEQVTCVCGTKLQVPTMRGLKQLEAVVDESELQTPRSSLQGPLFSIGLIALFIGAMIFLVAWVFPPPYLHADWQVAALTAADAQRAGKTVAELGVSDLYDEFVMLRDRTRSTDWESMRQLTETAQATQRNRHLAGGIFLGIGGLLTIVGLALPAFSARK